MLDVYGCYNLGGGFWEKDLIVIVRLGQEKGGQDDVEKEFEFFMEEFS